MYCLGKDGLGSPKLYQSLHCPAFEDEAAFMVESHRLNHKASIGRMKPLVNSLLISTIGIWCLASFSAKMFGPLGTIILDGGTITSIDDDDDAATIGQEQVLRWSQKSVVNGKFRRKLLRQGIGTIEMFG
mmetsp:Transcript_22530/g.33287  ORF Transcript_22530/g.33287 Transcript_22530/m.33287 type:complete len:130 (+) Transcript_22530:539-928(+)